MELKYRIVEPFPKGTLAGAIKKEKFVASMVSELYQKITFDIEMLTNFFTFSLYLYCIITRKLIEIDCRTAGPFKKERTLKAAIKKKNEAYAFSLFI